MSLMHTLTSSHTHMRAHTYECAHTHIRTCMLTCIHIIYILTIHGKYCKGENFAVVHKTHYSLEYFCSASGRGHDSRRKTFAIG